MRRCTAWVGFGLILAMGCDGSTTSAGDDGGGPSSIDPPPTGTDAGPGVLPGTDAGPMTPPVEPGTFDCAAAPGVTEGEPITATAGEWTWAGFEEARCLDGSSTGIGVNPGTSDRLLIVLEGGGACFDFISCAGVANRDGYGESKLERDARSTLQRGIFDREDESNPFADWSYVYVPYCTGDVHGGSNPTGPDDRVHVGYQNFGHFLTRIVPTFSEVSEVVLAGRSAGGLGTLVNYPQTADAFGCTPVHAIDDAGGILPDEYMRPCLQTRVREAWNLAPAVPDECSECTGADGGGLIHVLPHLASYYPDRRFAYISAMQDTVMRGFFGYGYSSGCDFPADMPADDYAAGLLDARDLISGYDNFRTYYVAGTQHTFTGQELGRTEVDDVPLGDWLGGMLGDGAWDDVGP